MKFIKKILIVFSFYLSIYTNVASFENKVLFKINNEIITSVDLLHEIEYIKILNPSLENLEKEKIFEIAKNSLIREKIKKNELLKYFKVLDVEQKYFSILLKEFIKRLNLKSENELNKFILSRGIEIEVVNQKIKNEILWNQLIVNKFTKDLKINKEKIKNDVLKNNKQKEFLLSEIVFNLDNEKLNDKFNIIKKEILKNGFESAALMYSISSTANNGGKLGWIKSNSLNEKIKNEITKTKIKDFTKPLVIPGGFLILFVEEQKETNVIIDVNKEIEIISREIANKQLNQFANIYFNKIKKEVLINEF